MPIVDVRPVWPLSGDEMLAQQHRDDRPVGDQFDVLQAKIARLQSRRLELIARIDQVGSAREIGAADTTVQVLAFRHRLDPPAARRDLIPEAGPCSSPPAESGSPPM
jgi:hypothetical protein